MKTFVNRTEIHQGEIWNIDKLVSASEREYIPYIVSSELENPYFVLTIGNTVYNKVDRYVLSAWNNIVTDSNIPRFYYTRPHYIGDLDEAPDEGFSPSDIEEEYLPADESADKRYLYQYTLSYEDIDESGHKPYHYLYFIYNNLGIYNHCHIGYECRLRFTFGTDVTKEFVSQNYVYAISLVSGKTLEETLDTVVRVHNSGELPEDWPSVLAEQYNYVKARWSSELDEDIEADTPLGKIEFIESILPKTELVVYNNIKRLI